MESETRAPRARHNRRGARPRTGRCSFAARATWGATWAARPAWARRCAALLRAARRARDQDRSAAEDWASRVPHDGACGGTCRLVSLEDIQGFHVRRRRLVAQRQAGDDSLPREGRGAHDTLWVRIAASGAHACRAAADDLNTALGGDLKLTDFGPRLPQLLRAEELEHFFVRRGRGEFVHTVTISWSASPSGDDTDRSIFLPMRCCCAAQSASDCEVAPRVSIGILASRNLRLGGQNDENSGIAGGRLMDTTFYPNLAGNRPVTQVRSPTPTDWVLCKVG